MEYKIYVPERIRMSLDDEGQNTLLQRKITTFKHSLLNAIIAFTGYEDALKFATVEFKKFNNTDNELHEVRCCDRVIATIYASRTEFNHQEILFSVFTDVFPYIKKSIKGLKKKFN